MYKKDVIYISIIVLLLAVIVGSTTYFLMDKHRNNQETEVTENNQENNQNENSVLKDNVKLVDVKEQNNEIVETFEIVINGKKNNLDVRFKSSQEDGVSGTLNNYLVFGRENVEKDSNLFTVLNIKNSFNENNFKFIEGQDKKNYLIVLGNRYVDDVILIMNDSLEFLNIPIEDDFVTYDEIQNRLMLSAWYNIPCADNINSLWYKNTFKYANGDLANSGTNFNIKFVDNNIYYLALKDLVLEERVYSINNNKVEYKVINSYNISANNICNVA